ncbi:hypothetical protein BDZ45DRAFT_743558 [Acephala macrosclerotiorum]|nr:hypothetical protein BDZ45DRAFT_743558 [Acephala macrosclerotiorum]
MSQTETLIPEELRIKAKRCRSAQTTSSSVIWGSPVRARADSYLKDWGRSGNWPWSEVVCVVQTELMSYPTLTELGTSEVEVYPLKRDGKVIWLIDTPRFGDTNVSNANVGMVYLHPITANRMSGSACKNVRIFKKLIGSASLECVVLSSTMWDIVAEDVGEQREEELKTTPEFWNEMVQKGSSIFRHDGGQESALTVIDQILGKNQKVVLDIQEQIVNQYKTIVETEAGKEVESAIIRERKKFERRMRDNEKDLEQALKDRDNRSAEELQKIKEGYQNQIDASNRAIESMRGMRAQRKLDEEKPHERKLELERLTKEIRTTKASGEVAIRRKSQK